MSDVVPAPRLVVTDALGRRIVNIDKPLFTIGRRTETDLRLPGADISRVHAEISLENGICIIRDKQSRFGTFVNGEKPGELGAGARRSDSARAGGGHRDRLLRRRRGAVGGEERGVGGERAAPDGGPPRKLRALGSGRVLDEVLAMVLDSAIEVTGAERGSS
jgi:hypothetical protein